VINYGSFLVDEVDLNKSIILHSINRAAGERGKRSSVTFRYPINKKFLHLVQDLSMIKYLLASDRLLANLTTCRSVVVSEL
jgi:hypothetical protein